MANDKIRVKKFYPADFNESLLHKPKGKTKTKCPMCEKEFVKHYSLKVHMKRIHAVECENKIYNYKCDVCNKRFSHLRHFKYHKKVHDLQSDTSSKFLTCPICRKDFQKQAILEHFEKTHTIKVETEVLRFPTLENFKTWKSELEKNEKCSFVKTKGSYSTKDARKSEYNCHRSGYFTSKSKGARHLKTQGSNKINAFCPASLKVTETNNLCEVLYVKTHIGHDNDVGHLFLTKTDRIELATKVAANIPFDSILYGICDSVTNGQLNRLHLLTKKDLFNIKQCFQLNSSSVQDKNDAVSVEDWVNEMKNCGCVLYYKGQDSVCLRYPVLKKEDFVLIIMNEGQKEMLQRYGNGCICLDRIHELNGYGFQLNTLLVLDQMREGFPCSFLISNRSDETVMTIFFSHIREVLETQIKPKVFMSDMAMAESLYNAWQLIINPADFRLFCTWHVDRDWRENLKKVDSKEKQVVVYQKLRALLQETDVTAFNSMIQSFIKSMLSDPMTSEFAKYFEQNYLHNVTSWAYCHRLHSDLNTNTHLERMHGSIEYLYLHGKANKRLDKAINAILKFVRDRLFDQIISQNKGKLCTKIKVLRQRHKASEKHDINSVLATENTDTTTTWHVPSSRSNEIYVVEERKINCNCKLLCSYCNVCLHHYSCTCLDSAIQWNMCKHIHLVCRYRKSLQTSSQTVEPPESQSPDTEENLAICEEQETIDNNFERKLQEFKANLMLQLDGIKTFDELEAVKKICASIQPTLDAMRNSRNYSQTNKTK